jgi:hypothetical protein
MNPHPEAGRQLAKHPDKAVKISLGLKNPPPLEASVDHVIPPILERDAQRPGHPERDSGLGQNPQAKTINLILLKNPGSSKSAMHKCLKINATLSG